MNEVSSRCKPKYYTYTLKSVCVVTNAYSPFKVASSTFMCFRQANHTVRGNTTRSSCVFPCAEAPWSKPFLNHDLWTICNESVLMEAETSLPPACQY